MMSKINLKRPINQKRQVVFIHLTGLSGWWWWLLLVNNCVWGYDSQVSNRIDKWPEEHYTGGEVIMLEAALAPVWICLLQNLCLQPHLWGWTWHPHKNWLVIAIFICNTNFLHLPKWIERLLARTLTLPTTSVFWGFFQISLHSVCISALLEFSFHGCISIIFLYHPPFHKVNKCVWHVKRSMPEMRFIDLRRIWNA